MSIACYHVVINEMFAHKISQHQLDSHVNLFQRQNLDSWGLVRRGRDIIRCQDDLINARPNPFRLYTWALHLSPFNPAYWVSWAYMLYQQGYWDLASGDAHRAFLLTEVLYDKS